MNELRDWFAGVERPDEETPCCHGDVHGPRSAWYDGTSTCWSLGDVRIVPYTIKADISVVCVRWRASNLADWDKGIQDVALYPTGMQTYGGDKTGPYRAAQRQDGLRGLSSIRCEMMNSSAATLGLLVLHPFVFIYMRVNKMGLYMPVVS